MKLRRHGVLLVVAAIAVSVTIHGCGGESGSDRTNLDRTGADRAAEQAKAQSETRVDAVDKALAAAVKAATAASDAAAAAKAASDAAASVAEAATKKGLNIEKAMAKAGEAASHSAEARRQSDKAAAAVAEAAAQVERHMAAEEHRDAAVASANAARISADIAAASAIEAARSLVTAQELSADRTPLYQTDLDRAAAAAKKKAEMEAAAAATAMAEAGKAATEAKKSMDAAFAARKAAAAAEKYATTATLDIAMAKAASDRARTERDNAAKAAMAARDAANKAMAAASGHQAAWAAEASTKDAEKYAREAAESATAAMMSYETARRLTADRNDANDLAAAADMYAETAKQQAEMAAAAAEATMAEVAKAKDATTSDAAEAARKAATTARDGARTASAAAVAAADAAEAINSDAGTVTARKTEARTHAVAALASLGKANLYFVYTAGYADARKARDEADAGKTDIDKFIGLSMRVAWIGGGGGGGGSPGAPTTAPGGVVGGTTSKTALDDAAMAARHAAEGLEGDTRADVIAARKNVLVDALARAREERAKAGNDLATAVMVYEAAKPFSEDGVGIDADSLASGKTLRHPSGRISLNFDAAQVYAAAQDTAERGQYDAVLTPNSAPYKSPAGGITSFGQILTAPGGTYAKYQMFHYNKWGAEAGSVYNYVSFGNWSLANYGFLLQSSPTSIVNASTVLAASHSFVFADSSNRTRDIPSAGTASYLGGFVSNISLFSGNRGSGGSTAVITGPELPHPGGSTGSLSAGTRQDYVITGKSRATIDFNTGSMNLYFDRTAASGMLYDVEGIVLDRSTSTFSGGVYLGTRGPSGTRTNPATDPGRISDPFKPVTGTISPLVPTMKLHGGVFGPNFHEIAGTIKLMATVPHGETAPQNLATARDGRITVNTAFAARKTSFSGSN